MEGGGGGSAVAPMVREEKDWTQIYQGYLDTSQPVQIIGEHEVNDGRELLSSPLKQTRSSRNSSPTKNYSTSLRKAPLGVRPGNDWKGRLAMVHRQSSAVKTVTTAQGALMMVPVKRGRGRPPKNEPPMAAKKILLIPPLMSGTDELFFIERPASYLHYAPMCDAPQFDPLLAEGDDSGWIEAGGSGNFMATVEYDMDEQDFAWLKIVNDERKPKGLPRISEDHFEFCIDRLEKYWFHLTKAYQKWHSRAEEANFSEDFLCEICGNGETTSNNLIVMCDGCDLAVHQDCYGVVHIPEGPWLCRKCYLGAAESAAAKCCLCPWTEGALKQTTDPKRPWAHLICAHYLPNEAQILNAAFQEPIDICRVDPGRHSLTCIYCKRKGTGSAPIQCSIKTCHLAFHPVCARKVGALLDYQKNSGLCWKHSYQADPSMKGRLSQHHEDHPVDVEEEDRHIDVESITSPARASPVPPSTTPMKRGRGRPPKKDKTIKPTDSSTLTIPPVPVLEIPTAANKSRSGSRRSTLKPVWLTEPIAPKLITEKIIADLLENFEEDYSKEFRADLVHSIAKYWSLKRASKRGTPLLRRLQFEPWSTTSSITEHSIEEQLETRQYLLADLRRLEQISAQLIQREKAKLVSFRSLADAFRLATEPVQTLLRIILRTAIKLDPAGFFHAPVPLEYVPDYLDHIKAPMDFGTMASKLESYQYGGLDEMLRDLELVWNNARTYNQPESVYYQAADSLEASIKPTIMAAQNALRALKVDRVGQISLKLLSETTLSTPSNEIFYRINFKPGQAVWAPLESSIWPALIQSTRKGQCKVQFMTTKSVQPADQWVENGRLFILTPDLKDDLRLLEDSSGAFCLPVTTDLREAHARACKISQ